MSNASKLIIIRERHMQFYCRHCNKPLSRGDHVVRGTGSTRKRWVKGFSKYYCTGCAHKLSINYTGGKNYRYGFILPAFG